MSRVPSTDARSIVTWAALAAWAALPLTLGTALDDAFDLGTAHIVVAAVVWLATLVGLAVPQPATLTASRLVVPAAVILAAWAAVDADGTAATIAGLVNTLLAAALVLNPLFADRFIDGASYGDERRFALRPPGFVLVALLLPTWAIAVAGAAAGPLALLDRRWVLGAVLLVIGWPLAAFAIQALDNLTARFVVFVPNGIVVHDLTMLREPVLFQQREIVAIGPAAVDTSAADLTNAALGLALELRLGDPVTVPVVTGRTTTDERSVPAILVSPSRPAAVLEVARARGLAIG